MKNDNKRFSFANVLHTDNATSTIISASLVVGKV